MRWWAGVLCCALLLALCAPAGAKVLLLDRNGTVVGLPVRDSYHELFGWTADGTGLLVRQEERTLRLDLATGATAPQPLLDDAVALGPGGRVAAARVAGDELSLEAREADGRVTASHLIPLNLFALDPPSAAWSADGTRVAFAAPSRLSGQSIVVVLDTLSGSTIVRAAIDEPRLPSQAFSPDGSAFLVIDDDDRLLRVDVPSARRTVVARPPRGALVRAAWGPGGQVALAHDDRIRIAGGPEVRLPAFRVDDLSWTKSGALTYVFVAASRFACGPNRYGVGLLAPGSAPRTLVAPSGAEVRAAIWSPDGETLAVDQDRDYSTALERRGTRHAWPRRIARDYEMFSRRGDAAIRRIVVRASRALRRGAGRAETLGHVSDDLERVAKRYDEVGDTAVTDAIAGELDKWLHAAGFARIDAVDEFSCG